MGKTLWQYLADRAEQIAQHALADIRTLADWNRQRAGRYREFLRSMGLDPFPSRNDLQLIESGAFAGRGYQGRNVAFQILPDCWATAGLYLPDPMPAARCPAVLYLCGHGSIGMYHYQQHPLFWARRGYVCLILDTIEQHDNPGEHHGSVWTSRWDWLSMGYTAAGGELWNSIRALDYLAALPEVDPARIGVTGVSGGGVQSFYLAAADDRIRAVAPICGVSTAAYALAHRHLHDHCDCVFMQNVYQRDQSEVAALIAPRPLLFGYAEHDLLFSPQEARELVERTRRVYRLYDAEDRCSLTMVPGPHGDKPEFVKATAEWFDQHVAGESRGDAPMGPWELDEPAVSVFNGKPPSPERLDLLPELLSRRGSVSLPTKKDEWPSARQRVIETLRSEVFRSLDRMSEPFTWRREGSWTYGPKQIRVQRHSGQIGGMDLWLESILPTGDDGRVVLGLAGEGESVEQVQLRLRGSLPDSTASSALESRVAGFATTSENHKGLTLRAGMLVGLTPTMMMIRDLDLVLSKFTQHEHAAGRTIYLYGRGDAAVACLYHALYHERVAGVLLEDLPSSHRVGGLILGILRVVDIDQALGLMAPRPVVLLNPGHGYKTWPTRAYQRLGCEPRFAIAPDLRSGLARLMEALVIG